MVAHAEPLGGHLRGVPARLRSCVLAFAAASISRELRLRSLGAWLRIAATATASRALAWRGVGFEMSGTPS